MLQAKEKYTLRQVINWASCFLKDRKIDAPRLSAELLAAKVLKISRLEVLLQGTRCLDSQELESFTQLIKRRALGEPVAYILGQKEFFGYRFYVTADVLIPRPETELIVDRVKNDLNQDQDFIFADLGTGSGNLAISLLNEFPKSKCLAVDISLPALKVTGRNISYHKVEQRILTLLADGAMALRDNSLDLVVANPPYVDSQEYCRLSPEIKNYEPRHALNGGPKGTEICFKMIFQTWDCLKPEGILIMEMDSRQRGAIEKFLNNSKFQGIRKEVIRDLNGHDRLIWIQKS